jgi:hypothetical protein
VEDSGLWGRASAWRGWLPRLELQHGENGGPRVEESRLALAVFRGVTLAAVTATEEDGGATAKWGAGVE